MILTLLLCCILGYLLGSIPCGLLLTRLAGKGDIRQVGSGNIGATNVLRTGSKGLAAATLLLDMAKGFLAIIISIYIIQFLMPLSNPNTEGCDPTAAMNFLHDPCGYSAGIMEYICFIAGAFAVIGHMFPIWLKYKGGKGVATFFGMITAFMWMAGLLALGTWLVSAILGRRSSLAALIATALTPVYMMVVNIKEILSLSDNDAPRQASETLWPIMLCIVIVALIWYQHRENIKRLRAGTEPKIGQK